jgi:hypothetical protein
MFWFIAKAVIDKSFSVENLNLIFVGAKTSLQALTRISGREDNMKIIFRIIQSLLFTGSDALIPKILAPTGSVHIWAMLPDIPYIMDQMVLKRLIASFLPTLYDGVRITGQVGEVGGEVSILQESLSLHADAPFKSNLMRTQHLIPVTTSITQLVNINVADMTQDLLSQLQQKTRASSNLSTGQPVQFIYSPPSNGLYQPSNVLSAASSAAAARGASRVDLLVLL